MKCPSCSVELKMSERQGIEIDYCPQCRGVWLDRGELDKIIERSNRDGNTVRENSNYPEGEQREAEERYRGQPGPQHRKRKGFLGDLFDLD